MLFEAMGQVWIFLLLIWIGILIAGIDEIGRFCYYIINRKISSNKKLPKQKNTHKLAKTTKNKSTKMQLKNKQLSKRISKVIISIIVDITRAVFVCFSFYLVVYLFNYGEVRLYTILAFLLGIFLERWFVNKFLINKKDSTVNENNSQTNIKNNKQYTHPESVK